MKKKTIWFVIIFILSNTLTQMVSRSTFLTTLEEVFIFCYFLLVTIILSIIYTRKIYFFSKKNLVFSFILGILFVLFISNNYSEEYQETQVIIQPNEEREYEEYNSIWISNIYVDNKEISLSTFLITEGWNYNEEWDDIVMVSSNASPLLMAFPRAYSIKIRFAYDDQFSNAVILYDGDMKLQGIELETDGDGYVYHVKSNQVQDINYLWIFQTIVFWATLIYVVFGVCISLIKAPLHDETTPPS